jgi:hypothetical protein
MVGPWRQGIYTYYDEDNGTDKFEEHITYLYLFYGITMAIYKLSRPSTSADIKLMHIKGPPIAILPLEDP